jgi:hypothetical protein
MIKNNANYSTTLKPKHAPSKKNLLAPNTFPDTLLSFCFTFLWPCIIEYTYFNNQLNAQIILFYNNVYVTLQSSTCFEHQHDHLQEDKLYITASGIVTLCKRLYSTSDESRLLSGILYSHLQRVTIPDAVIYNLSSWRWACWCSKHVEDCNVTYILLMNKGIVH